MKSVSLPCFFRNSLTRERHDGDANSRKLINRIFGANYSFDFFMTSPVYPEIYSDLDQVIAGFQINRF